MKKKIAIIGVALVCAIAVVVAFWFNTKQNTPQYRTAKVTRGNIRAQVMATGTLNAVTTILVGTQVSGTIKKWHADYNQVVKKGQLLAEIDPEIFSAQVAQATANHASAQADLSRTKVTKNDAQRTCERNKTLFAKGFIAKSDLDTAETNLQIAEASVLQAQAQVEQVKATHRVAMINLKNTKITSPVNGIVIARSIEVGQTVAASFQTPTLFTIAGDLTKMQVNVSVDEADIGRVCEGQAASFSVDAYPEVIFNGKVSAVRNAPTTVQNVVTYDVVIKVDNPARKLKPGMTANIYITTAESKEVLKVPISALRYNPTNTREAKSKSVNCGTMPNEGRLWVFRNNTLQKTAIKTGVSDGANTEVSGTDIKEGDEVVIDETNNQKKDKASSSTLSGGGGNMMRMR
ncbi:MAG: efflux RND transporter periplasmic adaptor subunit [Deltaproteobacteria bacterium]